MAFIPLKIKLAWKASFPISPCSKVGFDLREGPFSKDSIKAKLSNTVKPLKWDLLHLSVQCSWHAWIWIHLCQLWSHDQVNQPSCACGFRRCFRQEHINIHDWHEKYSEGTDWFGGGTERQGAVDRGENRTRKKNSVFCLRETLNTSCYRLALPSVTSPDTFSEERSHVQPGSMSIFRPRNPNTILVGKLPVR